jgi:hypothetical protein
MVGLDKVFHEVQNLFTSRWGTGIWTFVQSIDNNVGRALSVSWEIEHALKTLCKRCLARVF